MHAGGWLNAEGVRRFREGYDAAGILADSDPGEELKAAARDADVLAGSDLPRALASLERLAPEREAIITPLLREVWLVTPDLLPVRLPVEVWDWLDYMVWSLRLARHAMSEEVARAHEAIDWLAGHARQDRSVVAVTHGGFRRIVSANIVRRGWLPEPGPRAYHNWSAWSFRREEDSR